MKRYLGGLLVAAILLILVALTVGTGVGKGAAGDEVARLVGQTVQVESAQQPSHTFDFLVTSGTGIGFITATSLDLYGILTVDQPFGLTFLGRAPGSTIINWQNKENGKGESWSLEALRIKGAPPALKITFHVVDVRVR